MGMCQPHKARLCSLRGMNRVGYTMLTIHHLEYSIPLIEDYPGC